MFNFNDYFEAYTIQEALNYLDNNEKPAIIAGGTDVLIKLREGSAFVGANLVGITNISELKEVTLQGGDIIIGAAATFSQLEEDEVVCSRIRSLAAGAASVGGPQIRNVGTIGGNICNGATSADTASVLHTLNAIVMVENSTGSREIPISEFHLGPGKVKLEKGDLVRAFKIKKDDYTGYRGHYIKFSQRNAMDIATLGCAVLIKEQGGIIESLRIAFGVAGPTPLRAATAEAFAKGLKINEENLAEIGQRCLADTKARDSWRGSKAFREQLIKTLPIRAIKEAL